MTVGPSRGLPPRITIPIVAALAVVFLGIVGYFLKTALVTTGGAISPDVAASGVAQQGDSNIRATAAPGEEVVPQTGTGNAVGGGNAANEQGGGPPAPVQRLLTELRGRLAKNPDDLEALVSLASLYFDAGMFPRALPYYEHALAIDPSNPDTRTDYATALHGSGQDIKALAQLDIVLAKNPNFKEALFNEGIVASAIGRRTEAIGAFKKFLAVAPGDGRAGDARTAIKNLGG